MKLKSIFLAVLLTICSVGAFAQTVTPATPTFNKYEVSVGYSYVNENTKISFDSPSGFFNSFLGGLNGGDVSATYKFNPTFGLKADFAGYTQGGTFTTSGKEYNFAVGPKIEKSSGVFNPGVDWYRS